MKTLKSQMKKGEDIGIIGSHHVGANSLHRDSRMICCESWRDVGHIVFDSIPKNCEEVILNLNMKTPDRAEFTETFIANSDLGKDLWCK